MNDSILQISFDRAPGKPENFLKDPNSDMLVIVDEYVVPVHRQILAKKSSYANREIKNNERVHIIQSDLEPETLIQVVGCFYGRVLKCPRNQQILKTLAAIRFLEISELQDSIKRDLIENQYKYDFFITMQIAYILKLTNIVQSCWKELTMQKYEQINYNRSEFMNCGRQLVIEVLQQFVKDCVGEENKEIEFIEKYVQNLLGQYKISSDRQIKLTEIIDSQLQQAIKLASTKVNILLLSPESHICRCREEKDGQSTEPSPRQTEEKNHTFSSMQHIFIAKYNQYRSDIDCLQTVKEQENSLQSSSKGLIDKPFNKTEEECLN